MHVNRQHLETFEEAMRLMPHDSYDQKDKESYQKRMADHMLANEKLSLQPGTQPLDSKVTAVALCAMKHPESGAFFRWMSLNPQISPARKALIASVVVNVLGTAETKTGDALLRQVLESPEIQLEDRERMHIATAFSSILPGAGPTLDTNLTRGYRQLIFCETVSACQEKKYTSPSGAEVHISEDSVQRMQEGTVWYEGCPPWNRTFRGKYETTVVVEKNRFIGRRAQDRGRGRAPHCFEHGKCLSSRWRS